MLFSFFIIPLRVYQRMDYTDQYYYLTLSQEYYLYLLFVHRLFFGKIVKLYVLAARIELMHIQIENLTLIML